MPRNLDEVEAMLAQGKKKRAQRVKPLPGQMDLLDAARDIPPAPLATAKRKRQWPTRGVHGAIITILKQYGPKTQDDIRTLVEGLKGQDYGEVAVRKGIGDLQETGYIEPAGVVRCERYGQATLWRRRIMPVPTVRQRED